MAHHDHMAVLFDADVPVHYGFINLLGADEEDQADLMDTRAGQVNGLLGAAAPGQLSLVTGLHTGRVPLVVRWHDTEPALGDEWEDVVEASFEPPQADLLVTSFQDSSCGCRRCAVCGHGTAPARWTLPGTPTR
jgi:hypothetical protein